MTSLRNIAAGMLLLACSAAGLCADRGSSARQLISRLDQVWGSWQDYEYTGSSMGGGKTSEYKYYYKRPNLVRIDTHRGQVSVQPDGDIRGRLGKGLFGSISRRVDRDDHRLRDAEGIPFYKSSLPDTLARMRARVSSGATATVRNQPDSYVLSITSGKTTWKYVVDRQTLYPVQSERIVNGQEVEATRYQDFQPNAGLKPSQFKF